MLFPREGGYRRQSVQRLSQVVSEGPREEEVKHGPVSFERQSLKPTKGERQRDRQAGEGWCTQLNCTAGRGKWSNMPKSAAVKHFSEEVKQVMY